MKDPYLYKNTNVLKNKLGIRNAKELDKAENDIVSIKLLLIENIDYGKFDLNSLFKIHKNLFGDIYRWAGKPRKINIYKRERVLDGMSVSYSDYSKIKDELNIVFNRFESLNWSAMTLDEKARNLSLFTADIWHIHPFREGNTRTSITFMELFAKSKNINLDYSLFRQNPQYVRDSLVLASIGEYSDINYLINIIKDALIKGDKKIDLNKKDFEDKSSNTKSKNKDVVSRFLDNDPEALKAYNNISTKVNVKEKSITKDIDINK